jgi:hypothetical protein
VVLLGTVGGVVASLGDDFLPPTPEWFKWFDLLNWATGVVLLLSFFAVVSAILIWRRDALRSITKIKFSLVGVACLLLSWWAVHWNLIGPAHRI